MGVDRNRPLDRLPPPDGLEIWLDFDGTLTQADVVDALVRRYAASEHWRELEYAWQAGRIGSRECLSRSIRPRSRQRR